MKLKATNQIGDLSEVEQEAVALRAAGSTMRDVMIATGLNHSQAENAIMKATLTESDVARFEAMGADLGSRVVAAREAKLSWGVIMMLAAETEGAVRKAFTEATTLKSQGQRIGKGGRFYYGDNGQPLYDGELKPTGTNIPKTAKYEGAIKAAFEQRLSVLGSRDRTRLVSIAEQYGLKTKGVATKALVKQVIKAAAEVAERNEERSAKLAEASKPVAELTA